MTAEEPPLDELLEAWQRAERTRDEQPNGSLERAVTEEDVKFAHSAYRRRLRELEYGEPNLADLLEKRKQAEQIRDQVPEGSPLRPAVERQIKAAHDEYQRRLPPASAVLTPAPVPASRSRLLAGQPRRADGGAGASTTAPIR